MDLARVDVVLVRPARPANVAAACRAMKNMGLARLSLVGVPPGFVSGEARSLAYGAWDVLEAATTCADLREATASAAVVAGTSGRAGEGRWTPRALAAEAERVTAGGRLALVFGPEASGLRNDELALCHRQVHVPTAPAHPSLNLAQAVLILAYELRLAALAGAAAEPAPAPPAPTGRQEQALAELREALLSIGFLNRENPDAILAELRQMVWRAGPTERELALLRGLARQVRWAGARIAARPEGDG